MLVVDLFLYAEEIGERVVERSLHVASVGPSVADAAGKRPSLLAHTRAEGVHAAQGVVAVGTAEGEPLPAGHLRGPEVVVVAASHGRDGKAGFLEGKCKVHILRDVVDTADGGEAELAALQVIHLHTVDVDIVEFLVEGTVSESDR